MDNNKKPQNYSRPNSKTCPNTELNRKNNTDIQPSKPWHGNTRRREQNNTTRNDQQRSSKQYTTPKPRPYADKRPRQRGDDNPNGNFNDATRIDETISVTGAGLATEDLIYGIGTTKSVRKNVKFDYESNAGRSKHNLQHLLNFHCKPRASDYSLGLNVFGHGGASNGNLQRQYQSGKKHKYNKEQFLQANFQFVVKSCAKSQMLASPDTLIDWDAIEQIIIQTTEEPQCPICLYPPIAAKLTRCGHVYCWPCILHYLALSDKTWRKCPICHEAIHIGDLKSTSILQQRTINVDSEITFHLMRRKKNSIFIEKFTTNEPSEENFPSVSSSEEEKYFSKLIIANKSDILDIIERERNELTIDEDQTCPEFVFIQQALDLLNERREKLGEIIDINKEVKKTGMGIMEKKAAEKVELKNTAENADETSAENATEINDDAGAAAVNLVGGMATKTTKYYYFYQSEDGQNIYLHPLNIKMLQACYGTLDLAPRIINARILQKEQHSMDEEHRRKFTFLGHLPLTCQFSVVEVDLQPPIVSGGILKLFKDDLLYRKKERQRRDREERKREKHINEINDRQMGKLIASTANLNLCSTNEFPTCGFEESLISVEAEQQAVTSSTKTSKTVSYSAVAVDGAKTKQEYWPTLASSPVNSYNKPQELLAWGNMSNTRTSYSDNDDACNTSPISISFGDVLAEALSQKKQGNSSAATVGSASGGCAAGAGAGSGGGAGGGGANKKNKKARKMLPLFSTGMNYNGN